MMSESGGIFGSLWRSAIRVAYSVIFNSKKAIYLFD
jgi:hypothetical protein